MAIVFFSRFPLLRRFPVSSPALPYSSSIQLNRRITISASISTAEESTSSSSSLIQHTLSRTRWKPMCLYFTQGKCTKMDDPMHIDKFNHNCSLEFMQNAARLENLRQQEFEYFLVLDLEGKVEILEFPVLLFDAKTLDVVDLFHRRSGVQALEKASGRNARFVRPTKMHEERINQYIEGKYGKLGVDRSWVQNSDMKAAWMLRTYLTREVALRSVAIGNILARSKSVVKASKSVWHDTAVPFAEVIEQFEVWLSERQLWRNELGVCLNNAAFVTCGNWDLKTKVPQQCSVAGMKLPPYFNEWINLKDVFLNFYKRRAPGMLSMMRELQIPLSGSHHLGIDDSNNIARVIHHMLTDGALLQITAKRNPPLLDILPVNLFSSFSWTPALAKTKKENKGERGRRLSAFLFFVTRKNSKQPATSPVELETS
ncbi:putative E3 SUMO-protein ligase MMS21-like [Capsicum annuum]|nr:putative E3 SUMO-protein ligase MMS21-like [Capsicum annuum]